MGDRIHTAPEIADADRAVLEAFDNELALQRYSPARHEKLLRHLLLIAEGPGGLANALTDRAAAERIVRWIHATYENEETNRDYRVAPRVCGRYVSDDSVSSDPEDPPPSIDWVPSTTSRTYTPKPDPRELLHWDDQVRPLIDACENVRDEAMIAVAWDAGCRSGKFRNLTVGDVTDHPNGLQITVDGKTGQRTVTLIPSVPFVNRWLASHDYARCQNSRPDAPL